MKLQVLVLLCLFGGSSAFFINSIVNFFRGPEWNGLKVKWGLNPFTSFKSMPRTTSAALSAGFVQVSGCDASPTAKHRGARYVKDGDETLVLLFDVNGYIAGIQMVVPSGLPNDYPARGLTPPFVQVGNSYYLTAYFVQPATICTTGRTDEEFEYQGTGTMVVIQNGTHPDTDLVTIPKREADLAGTPWVKGKCIRTMGVHYWYDVRLNTDCDRLFPIFALYNSHKLNAFGWAMTTDIESNHVEHPPPNSYTKFIDVVPTCMSTRGTLTTMHIYLDRMPLTNFC